MKIRFLAILLFVNGLFYNELKAQSCVGTAGQVKWSYWTNPLWANSRPDSVDLSTLENFPSRPDGSQTLGSLQMPQNFNDFYCSMVRGYIKVPQTANYHFNITGDDNSLFYLSTDASPANKRKRAEVKNYSGTAEHYKEAGQTSQVIQLVGGQYYYFEMYNYEGWGSDHATIFWRNPPAAGTDTTWRIIDYNYIYEYACGQNCAVRGTPCNDGNPLTTNDQQDGFCNCVGIAPKPNACIGDRGVLEAYYYDNIAGTYVENDLLNAPKFPLLPDRKENLLGAYGPLAPSLKDNYGTLVQGYLTVPVSGTYEFVLTGDNQTFFYMSKNDSLEYKQYHQALVYYGVDENEFYTSSFQQLAPLYLEKGKYYYFEFRHKENSWRDGFNLFWKTPFHEIKSWKRVPNFYLFDYKCELACIPQGTPCNDGNPLTKNDQYNSQCECVGTPCSGPDCDDAAGRYQFYDVCSPTQNLTTREEASWLSCTTAPNPNPARASYQKWIKYDFTNQYKFQSSRVWNYNVASETDRGFKTVFVDYSVDGTTWLPLGATYTWPQASASSDYAGFIGPNFNDVKARYILISAIDNWGDPTCSGFSKISFNAIQCDPKDTPCDDGDPLTFHDKFDNNCNCKGININCTSDTIKLNQITLSESAYKAKKYVEAVSISPANKNISFTAGNSIVLLPGFEANREGVFSANIKDCLQAAFVQNQAATKDSTVTGFSANGNETNQIKKVIFRLNKPTQVKLLLQDAKGNNLVTLIDGYSQNLGTQIKLIPTTRLPKGDYWVELRVGKDVLREKITI